MRDMIIIIMGKIIALLITAAGFFLHDNIFMCGVIIFMLINLIEYVIETNTDVDEEIDNVLELFKHVNIKKICSRCKDKKSLLEFDRHRGRSDGFDSICKMCKAEKHQENKPT